MTTGSRDINALLGSRICHDLISPLGAIGNGVELLTMSGISAAPEIALIAESVENANARIRFFRIAFGASTPDARIGRAEIHGVLDDVTKGTRLSIDWQPSGDLPRQEVKLAFLLIQCLETAMPWGGQITAAATDGRWRIEATAGKLKVEAELWEMLSNPMADTDLSSAEVHFALVPDAARRIDRQVTLQITEARIVAGF